MIHGKILIEKVSTNREKWLELKKNTVGASEINTICGLNKFKTRLQLWAEKTGRAEPEPENEYMRLGTYMEPFIVQMFERAQNAAVIRPDCMYRHPELEWATCTPDGLVIAKEGQRTDEPFAPQLLECKNVNYRSAPAWEDGIPNYAHMQTIWGMGVLGLQAGFVAALVGADANQFHAKPVQYAAELFEQMVELGAQFMHMVKTDTPPEASAEDMSLLKSLQKKNAGEILVLDSVEDLKLFIDYDLRKKRYAKSKKEMETDEKDMKNVEAKIRQRMGSASEVKCGQFVYRTTLVDKKPYMVNPKPYYLGNLSEQEA